MLSAEYVWMDEKEGTQAIFGQQGATCEEMGEMPNWPANTIQQNTNYLLRWPEEKLQTCKN